MDHYSHPMDLPVSETHMQMVGQVSSNPAPHLYYAPMPVSSNTMFNTTMVPTNGVGHNESRGSMGPRPIYITEQLSGDASMMNSETDGKTPLPVKRKAESGPLVSNFISPRAMLPNKRPAHMGPDFSSAGFLQLNSSAPQRKTAPAQSRFGSPGLPVQSMPNKKMARNDSTSGKSGLQRGQSAKRQTSQIDSASKVRTESSEAVRSKMRESLAGALALAVQKQDNASITEKNQSETTVGPSMDSQASEAENSKDFSAFSTVHGSHPFSAELLPNGSRGTGGDSFQGFQYSSILPDDDVTFGDNFFAKDDLLQGNGLSWAFAFDAQMVEEGKEAQHDKNLKPVKEEEAKVVSVLTPENLAFKIEAELFKLFGGVNKKYREKARSLLFNLKDRNNPDLRESVMSGEISPERLCSMSAEELASKELSQWRMAKAEEFAQMVVLPDTEVDVRRLVKKSHKGEYQVEVDHDDDIAAEVSSGNSMLTLAQPKKVTAPQSPSKLSPKDRERIVGQGSVSEDQDFSGSLIIPTDGTDLMQGMIVDELKDAEFLPPIVSLDEFMESLNNEPPFEDLSKDAQLMEHKPREETPKAARNSRGAFNSDSPKDAHCKQAVVFNKHDVTEKSSGSPAKPHDLPSNIMPKVEYIWSGTLQIHISSSVTVSGLFQSGEKMSTKEWPTSLEIKGRVRLDAFEKFLQELPMSRTRAVMVLQYVLNDTSEIQRTNLSEAINSYITDERLGYAEPAPGVELYLCPTTPRISEMLNKLIPKENQEINNTANNVENGLMGVVVWRRAHISKNTISPNTTSHHKHASKKQPFAPPQRVHNVNVNNNSTPSMIPPPGFNNNRPVPEKEEDDDIPPGFGPGAVARKDDDDLPEFNFAKPALNHPFSTSSVGAKMTQRPVDQVRELIKKYGQSGTSVNSMSRVANTDIGVEPWEDDDDIPEWRPQGLPVHLVNQQRAPMVSHQQQLHAGVGHPGRGGRWVQPPGPQWRQY